MNLPETRQQKNMLFDFYEALLTAKQREVFTMHYMDDHSFAEIAESMGTTPQAVADILKRVNGRLNNYEKLLGMVEKHKRQQEIVEKINYALENGADVEQIRYLLNEVLFNGV